MARPGLVPHPPLRVRPLPSPEGRGGGSLLHPPSLKLRRDKSAFAKPSAFVKTSTFAKLRRGKTADRTADKGEGESSAASLEKPRLLLPDKRVRICLASWLAQSIAKWKCVEKAPGAVKVAS